MIKTRSRMIIYYFIFNCNLLYLYVTLFYCKDTFKVVKDKCPSTKISSAFVIQFYYSEFLHTNF